jgi:hypothetical protein
MSLPCCIMNGNVSKAKLFLAENIFVLQIVAKAAKFVHDDIIYFLFFLFFTFMPLFTCL